MPNKSSIIALIVFIIFEIPAICLADDSIPAKELQEIVVEGQRSWIDGEKVVYIPTKKEKNVSWNISSLLKNMNLPMINVSPDETVADLNGNQVSYFINGKPATDIDIKTFWPKDAKSVEYYSNPSDPKFGGRKSVINFIMPKYKVGGVGMINGLQSTRIYGIYQAANRMVYKRMTYGMSFYSNFRREQYTYDRNYEYNDLYYDNQYYNKIINHQIDTTKLKRDNITAGFQALYRHGNIQISNTVYLAWQRDPWQTMRTTNSWNPMIFQNDAAGSGKQAITLSPTYIGECWLNPHPQWYLEGSWQYNYNSAKRNSYNWTGIYPPIENASDETSHTGKFSIMPTFVTRDKFLSVNLKVDSHIQRYTVDYNGSYDNISKQWRGTTSIVPKIQFLRLPNTMLEISAGANIEYWKTGDYAWNYACTPIASFGGRWNWKNRLTLNANYSYTSQLPQADLISDATIRQSELLWLQGNPELKSPKYHHLTFSAFWKANKWFSMSLAANYDNVSHGAVEWYNAAPKEMEGVVKTFIDGKPFDTFKLEPGIYLNFLSNDLVFRLSPTWRYYKAREGDGIDLHDFHILGVAQYRIKNFSFYLSYITPRKEIGQGGLLNKRESDCFNISAGYGNGNLYINAELDNVFNTTSNTKYQSNLGAYSSMETFRIPGRTFFVRISYFFKYGKQIEGNAQMQYVGVGDSSVLGGD